MMYNEEFEDEEEGSIYDPDASTEDDEDHDGMLIADTGDDEDENGSSVGAILNNQNLMATTTTPSPPSPSSSSPNPPISHLDVMTSSPTTRTSTTPPPTHLDPATSRFKNLEAGMDFESRPFGGPTSPSSPSSPGGGRGGATFYGNPIKHNLVDSQSTNLGASTSYVSTSHRRSMKQSILLDTSAIRNKDDNEGSSSCAMSPLQFMLMITLCIIPIIVAFALREAGSSDDSTTLFPVLPPTTRAPTPLIVNIHTPGPTMSMMPTPTIMMTESPSEVPTPIEGQRPMTTMSPTSSPSSNTTSNSTTIMDVEEFLRMIITPLSGEQVLSDMSSPQFQALTWLIQENEDLTPWSLQTIEDDEVAANKTRILLEHYALAVFFVSTGGGDGGGDGPMDWNQTLNVSTTSTLVVPVCDNDERIICTKEGFVTQIDFADNNLTGTLPSELSTLTLLETLRLSSNYLRGTIPPEWETLTNLLVLELQYNQLTGIMPMELSILASTANRFQLEGNNLTGTLDLFCNQTTLLLSADCGGVEPEIDCPCCVFCCDDSSVSSSSSSSSSGGGKDASCTPTVRGICEQDKLLFEMPSIEGDNMWYQEGAGTICECIGTGEGTEFMVSRLSCTDTTCQSCDQNGTVCVVSQEYGFGYNDEGTRTDYTVTFQYVGGGDGPDQNDTVTLEKRYLNGGGGSNNTTTSSSSSVTVFVNGLWCNMAGEEKCSSTTTTTTTTTMTNSTTNDTTTISDGGDGGGGLEGYYYVDCDTMFVAAGSTVNVDFCDDMAGATAVAEGEAWTMGPLIVFAFQDPALRQGCLPRFPPL